MNRIYLDKLCEFSINTYKNYSQFNKIINLNEELDLIKQNNSLNEKGVFFKYNFIDLSCVISNIIYDEIILLNPLCFNLHGNIEWYNFLNSILSVLNNNYIHENNIVKKMILETADKTYQKKIVIQNIINNEILEKVCKLTNISLIILTNNSSNNLIINDNENTKFIVLFKHNKEYYPVINWNKKYYSSNDNFILYLKKYISDINKNNNEYNNLKNKSKLIKIISNEKVINENNKEIDKNDYYEELPSNENYALYVSEAIDTNLTNKNINNSDTKKKSKKSKDIFVITTNTKNKNTELEDESVFIKTETISKKEIDEINKNLKISLTLAELQNYAIKLGINIISGSTKTGKPKNKTKNELFEEITTNIKK